MLPPGSEEFAMKQSVDALTEAEQSSRAAFRALWDIQSGFLKRSAYLQYSLATIGVEGGLRQWQLWTELTERDAALAGQQAIAESLRPRLAAVARETQDTLRAWTEELATWMLGGFVPAAAVPRPAAVRKTRPARRSSRKKST